MNVDLGAYFGRIGHTGSRTATLETLSEIVFAHAVSIPFENLDPLSGQPVTLTPTSLEEKMIHRGRGGYCFEHNLLLADVLRQLGFEVSGLAARVMWNAPETLVMPRSHMLLAVQIDERTHIVDAGFGGLTLTGVLRLEPDVEQRTPHEDFRILADSGEYILQARVREAWRPLYRFDLQRQRPVDYEPVNWYLSTHPQSRFVTTLIAARTEPGRRYALLNRELAVHDADGTRRRTLHGAGEVRSALENEFRVKVPSSPQLDAALERIAAGP